MPHNRKEIREFLKKQFNLSGDQIDTMLPGFIDTLASHMSHLEEALQSGDNVRLGKAGHVIKGALLNLGLSECAEIAYIIEKEGKNRNENADFQALVYTLKDKLADYIT
jgi:HPt (histidine-containing phosphotransfer) domain-containing protein